MALDSSLNTGNTVGYNWKLYFSSNSSHLLILIQSWRGQVYSNCKENIITEDICDTVSASPPCSYKYLRGYTDTWVPISVGAVFL